MNCQTMITLPDGFETFCGHSIVRHEGDESGMGGAQPCMMPACPCDNFTRRCDGNHAMPECADPQCWHRDQPASWSNIDEDGVATGKAKNINMRPLACPMCGSAVPAIRNAACTGSGGVHVWHHGAELPELSFDAATPKQQEILEGKAADRAMAGKTVVKWADSAMFTAEPLDADAGPKVHLLSMTPDPLAAIAAACKMYKGEVARSYRDVSHAERQEFVRQVLKTKLQAPFEFVQFHFLVEGVTRAFTHQMVRQRTAVYAQESLRFAVKSERGVPTPVALPPSLAGTVNSFEAMDAPPESERQSQRDVWDNATSVVDNAYAELLERGMPAEDARGLLPHNTLTRLHYSTNLRALLDHAGNRLCTQAQFEWRLVFSRIAEVIRNYNPHAGIQAQFSEHGDEHGADRAEHIYEHDRWQYELLADLFRPVCYATGKCEFMAEFDRACNIRDRVQANHRVGRDSSKWAEELDVVEGNPVVSGVGPQSVVRNESGRPVFIGSIKPAEWLLDPGAAR